MNSLDNKPRRINRNFHELTDESFNNVDQTSILSQFGWPGTLGWVELLKSQRVLIVSEAGTGKTHECRAEQAELWEAGEPVFYFDLAELCRTNLRDLLTTEEEERFDAWLTSQSDIATIFLDSIDELQLTRGSFEGALKRLNKALVGQLGRVRVLITTRPIPVDLRLIQQYLPVPEKGEAVASGEAFADVAMNRHRDNKKDKQATEVAPAWRNVALMPLSDDQIREMATVQGVTDTAALLADIRKRNAEEFARRPQDLIELCVDWRDHHRIRTHREQVAHNIEIKLKPRTGRGEKAQLTAEKALEGASRLALATLLTRKLTIRHSAEADRGGEPGTALDPEAVLPHWSSEERETLLERALFGFASYGRVRFHHRSVIEYLAAQQLENMLSHGMSMKAVKRLLFAETPQGLKVVKPSMQPIAAWLAFSQPSIFSEVLDREPDLLLDYADPESLTPQQRCDALRSYISHYGKGTWRGLHVPRMQVLRFASIELAPEVLRFWESGIENPEVRELLLELIAAVPMPEGADIAYAAVMCGEATVGERMNALEALIKLSDYRLELVISSIETDPILWPDSLVNTSIQRLFPAHIHADNLCRILSRITISRDGVDDLNWFWPQAIAESEMTPIYLETLRVGLTDLVTEGIEWSKEWPHLVTPRQHLVAPLAAVCLRQLTEGDSSAPVVESSVIALRLTGDDYVRSKEPATNLRNAFGQSPASLREAVFWAGDAFTQKLHSEDDPWKRYYEAVHRGAINLNASQDASWVLANLANTEIPFAERRMMLTAAIRETRDGNGEWHDHLIKLKDLVADSPKLIECIEEYLKPVPDNPEHIRRQEEHQIRQEQAKQQQTNDHASWVSFWQEVVDNPQTAFDPKRAENTAWNLWKTMRRSGEESRASGWNRRFIEKYFSKDIADRLRATMMEIWRNDLPTLRTERPDDEKDTFLIRWQLGLAAVAAEAEDPSWARKLTSDEAKLAARYAPLELNGFPSWLEGLATAHPVAVESILGPELSSELNDIAKANYHPNILQNISHAGPSLAALFHPRLCAWFTENVHCIREGEDGGRVSDRLRRVIDILLSSDDSQTRRSICTIVAQQLAGGLDHVLAYVWLPTLMRLDPVAGTERLEQFLVNSPPGQQGSGEDWIGFLFGDRYNNGLINLHLPEFTPALLLRLVRLAYRAVPSSEDIHHESIYTPGQRDHAQAGRNALLGALLRTKGPDGWAAKLLIADDPLLAHFRDRALSIAREKAAEESDGAVFSESEVIALYRNQETSPLTRDEMFAIMVDRLDDLDDLLLRDYSPRAAWAMISDEKAMRQVIARELINNANHAYTVDQEGVTADEKETDIRLRATSSDQQAVIELKIGDGRSGRDLRDTIKEQLVTKYMAPEYCRSGCLLITVAKNRGWEHPDTNETLDVSGLETMLRAEAEKLVAEMGLAIRLTAQVLDLRPRLPTEKEKAKMQK